MLLDQVDHQFPRYRLCQNLATLSSKSNSFQELQNILVQNKIEAYEIGAFKIGEAVVQLEDRDRSAPLGRLESERFASDSWFHKGVEFYQSELEGLELP